MDQDKPRKNHEAAIHDFFLNSNIGGGTTPGQKNGEMKDQNIGGGNFGDLRHNFGLFGLLGDAWFCSGPTSTFRIGGSLGQESLNSVCSFLVQIR